MNNNLKIYNQYATQSLEKYISNMVDKELVIMKMKTMKTCDFINFK